MSRTLTIRLTEEQAIWLKDTARKTGVAQGRLVRDHLDRARNAPKQSFLKLLGTVSGPRDLSSRKGFSRG
jgi:hypothetical protein